MVTSAPCSHPSSSPLLLAITGATGIHFAVSFLSVARRLELPLHAIISESGERVLELECGLSAESLPGVDRWYRAADLTAPPSSGSSRFRGMVILPCTMGTLAAVAHGITTTLIHRAAAVTLKERRPLLLAVRETPLNRIHLQNMLAANDAGAVIFPPMPGYYLKPESLEEAAETFVWRLFDHLVPECDIAQRRRWE